MSLPSMMFPGHLNGSNLFSNGHQQPPNSASGIISNIPSSLPAPVGSYHGRAGVGPTVPVSAPAPGLFPTAIRPLHDFGSSALSLPLWPYPFSTLFGFQPSQGVSSLGKNGAGIGNPIDFSSWCAPNPSFLRPPLPPHWPQAAYQPSCIPKQSLVNAEIPSKKRHCNNARQHAPSPSRTMAQATSGSSSSLPESGKCCPICSEVLPTTSAQELRRHLMEDAVQTEEQFIQLKRKMADSSGAAAATFSSSAVSPDPAVKSRLETFQRVRENRMMRMREKLANVQQSQRPVSPMVKLFVDSEHTMPVSNDEDANDRETARRSVTSSGSHNSSAASRSASRLRSPATDDTAKTPASASSYSLSPTETSSTNRRHQCQSCSNALGSMTTCKKCRNAFCSDCWQNASDQVDNPVCPNCASSIPRENYI